MLQWIKRASRKEKEEMAACIAASNELAYEHEEWNQYVPFFRLERCGDCWGIVQYVDYPHPDFADIYEHGQEIERGGFARCSECGDVDDHWEGQPEICFACGAE